ncbi:hypothetical protein Pmani_013548 [Petrolisthes manimaculis]|uniref:Uncharacterized protein n=1 Tax=Petrolisthes manimaculis TaxID=1843537 RepID=A0AAE1PX28_9EUCA|nr:hypothetical protein Pmani_013548 [Petrolisthes manimaculis]
MVRQISEVCAMLHNICKDRNIHIPVGEDLENSHLRSPHPAVGRLHEGLRYRDEFINFISRESESWGPHYRLK